MENERFNLWISRNDHVRLKTTAAQFGLTIGEFVVNMLRTLHPLPASGGWAGIDGNPTSEETVRKIKEASIDPS